MPASARMPIRFCQAASAWPAKSGTTLPSARTPIWPAMYSQRPEPGAEMPFE